MIPIKAWLPLAAALVLVAACAVEVVRRPVDLAGAGSRPREFVAERAVAFTLDSGYSRSVAAGTEFVEAGTVPQGRVLKPTRATITVEGAHVHEAYPVVQGGKLVGFYLPVERAYTPLTHSVDFPIQERKAP